MATKSIRIYGVLSKITLAKDQPSTIHAPLEMKKPQPAKAIPTAPTLKKAEQ